MAVGPGVIVRVQVSYDDDAWAASPTWVDISSDVRLVAGLWWEHGRADRWGDVANPAVAGFTVDNHTGKWTVGNVNANAKWYYGRAVRIQLSRNSGSTWVTRFRGVMVSAVAAWDDATGLNANAVVSCACPLSRMATATYGRDIVRRTIQDDGPKDYWPLSESGRSPRNLGVSPSCQIGYNNESPGVKSNTGTTPGGGASGGSPWADVTTGFWVDEKWWLGPNFSGTSNNPGPAAYDLRNSPGASAEVLVTAHGLDDSVHGFPEMDLIGMANQAVTSYIVLQVYPDSTNALQGKAHLAYSNGSTTGSIAGATPIGLEELHHYAWSYNWSDTSLHLYVDGIEQGSVTIAFGALFDLWGVWNPAITSDSNSGGLTVSHAAFYDRPGLGTSGNGLNTHYVAGLTGFADESADDRVNRLLSLFWGTNATTSTLPAGTRHVGGLDALKGASVLSKLNEVEGTELGVLWYDPAAGVVTARSRQSMYDQAAAMTLPNGSVGIDLQIPHDDVGLVNDFTATAKGSSRDHRVQSTASQGVFSQRPDSKELVTIDENEAQAFAEFRVGTGLPDTSRLGAVSVDWLTYINETGGTALLDAWWATDLGDKVALSSAPSQAPSSAPAAILIGYRETYDSAGYDATLTTIPSVQYDGVWKLNDSTLSVLDSTTVLAY